MAGRGSKKQVTLTQALAHFLGKTLLPDLKTRAQHPAVAAALMRQWQAETGANHTADGFLAWEQRTLEQVGAAWVLSCVFVRTLEDRDLLARRRLAGPGAADSEQLFFEIAPSLTARDYLLTAFREVASLPGAEDLLGAAHNPVWRLAPSAETARALLEFFRLQDAQGGLVWRFDGTDTRFLGDLYQNLSEDVRKRYALLQTPDFVERFILEQTLEPAIAEFGLEVRVIDPTCGSGHFLLGAFDRLLTHRQQAAPAVDVRDHALAALEHVYGVDVNPYAVAIARFRLTLVYLQRAGITKLAQSPRLPLKLVVADSLLHGATNTNVLFAEHEIAAWNYKAWGADMFALEDPQSARNVFGQRYHVVVGNPPYITCKDNALRDEYRSRFKSASGAYALSAPFTERFFGLATAAGFVGMINASSFAKREFGKSLIESVLADVDISKIVDTSGAYLPGHGTPTLLLFGRNRRPVTSEVVGMLRKRGESNEPKDPARGPAWLSIVSHHSDVGFENEYFSVEALPRHELAAHPWITRGGGVRQLKKTLEQRADSILGEVVSAIGRSTHTGEDSVFFMPMAAALRNGISEAGVVPLVKGEQVRDWCVSEDEACLFPYDKEGRPRDIAEAEARHYWRYRTSLKDRQDFGQKIEARGLRWVDHSMFFPDRFRTPLSIAFAFVASHNHFALDRGGKVFKQSAPIIKLGDSATEDEHLALLAYLNSSTACFWMKQVLYPKGGDQMGDGGRLSATEWEDRYEFASTALLPLPLPALDHRFVSFGRRMDDLVRKRTALLPVNILAGASGLDPISALSSAREEDQRLFEQMVALQEALDWHTYRAFRLTDVEPLEEEAVRPGYRAFECIAWTRLSEDAPDREWFRRSRFNEPTRDRINALATTVGMLQSSRDLSVIEDFNYKRRWQVPNYDADLTAAMRALFLDAAEKVVRAGLRPVSAHRVVDSVVSSDQRHAALGEAKGGRDAAAQLIAVEAVPMCSAEIFTPGALQKRATWHNTWVLQRREDSDDAVGQVPIPPKYDQKDYRDASYWRLRGKMDVPKERFIGYPGCEKDNDASPLIGWAGWNHLQRAQALVALYQERKDDDGWPRQRLMIMLVGLHELLPWLELWHSQPDAGSQNPAREFRQFLDAELHAHGLTVDDLEAWRPPTRKPSAKRTTATVDTPQADTEPAVAKPKRTRRRKPDVTPETP
jgi:hypothetical protein